jgi:hypothetical protein
VIFTLNRVFPRGDARTAGRLVQALDELLSRGVAQENLECWLSYDARGGAPKDR